MVMGTNCVISIHALLAESDAFLVATPEVLVNFYPRSPCGERPTVSDAIQRASEFLSTLSLRRATNDLRGGRLAVQFLSTLSLRRATPWHQRQHQHRKISIHALLAESDRPTANNATTNYEFLSTLSLRRATPNKNDGGPGGQFLSTLSLRRATLTAYLGDMELSISIHALLAESDHRNAPGPGRHQISIHALLAESDHDSYVVMEATEIFLSTLSLRRATTEVGIPNTNTSKFLSTLSLRRATKAYSKIIFFALYFYPRSPCGERPIKGKPASPVIGISIHALLAESDGCENGLILGDHNISIHALLAESDTRQCRQLSSFRHFYPRSPCGERPPA